MTFSIKFNSIQSNSIELNWIELVYIIENWWQQLATDESEPLRCTQSAQRKYWIRTTSIDVATTQRCHFSPISMAYLSWYFSIEMGIRELFNRAGNTILAWVNVHLVAISFWPWTIGGNFDRKKQKSGRFSLEKTQILVRPWYFDAFLT